MGSYPHIHRLVHPLPGPHPLLPPPDLDKEGRVDNQRDTPPNTRLTVQPIRATSLVKICEQREVEFFIVAKQHRNLMNAVREIQDSNWKSFADRDLQADARGRRRRRRRANLKRKIAIRRKPNSRFKGAPEVAGMMFKPKSWNKARRYVIKRTPIVDKDDQQLYLDDGLRQYVYWIVVSNSKRSNEQVLRIAQGRGNQENLIKDLCVQQRLARSAGDRPAGVRARAL